jgi:hypothetical protein
VSSKNQEREGLSIPAQQKLLREYALEHHLTIARDSSMSRPRCSPGAHGSEMYYVATDMGDVLASGIVYFRST